MTQAAAPGPWRCFVAVLLPDDLREALRAWVAEVRRGGTLAADWRWTDPDGWHITLAFLGATALEMVPGIVDHLSHDLEGREGFSVAAGGIGAFPGRSRARVLWYGIQDADRRLAELARVVRAATATDEAAPFRPHITLARARERQGAPLPSRSQEPPTGEVPVDAVMLMRSHLTGGPARYEVLAEFPLNIPIEAGAPA
jgi:RNA 2',3'-cyclic 3'-phosphodiesterase